MTLESTPTGGYRWHPSFNTNLINLISRKFVRPSQKLIGGTASDIFTFKAIESGTTVLKMVYKRDWEEIFVTEKNFLIDIQ